jgi:hypothetical protein
MSGSESDEDICEIDFFGLGKRKRQKPTTLEIFETEEPVEKKTKKGIIGCFYTSDPLSVWTHSVSSISYD